MFDEKTQKLLDRMKFKQCESCKRWFLLRGVPGSRVLTLKQHQKTHTSERD